MTNINILKSQINTKLEEIALQTIESYHMFEQGEPVTVGFSGGADSVALLHLLYNWHIHFQIEVKAVHLNHLLRGKESYRDQEFSQRFCQNFGIPFYSKEVDIAAYSKQYRFSIEEAARKARYQLFYQNTLQGKIATAHTLSDSVETMLLNLTRGTGLEGLTGIPPVRDRIIRPLIHCTREQVENYCAHYKLDFVTDSTNLQDEFTRNKVRLHVVPVLKNVNPNLEDAIWRTNELIKRDNDYLENQGKKALKKITTPDGYDLKKFIEEDFAISSRILKHLLETHKLDVSYKRIELLLSALEKKENVQLSSSLYMQVSGNCFIIAPMKKSSFMESEILLDKFPIYEEIPLDVERKLVFETVECKVFENNDEFTEKQLINLIDYDKIEAIVKIRKRKPGDKFSPRGRGVTKTLKKLLNEENIPVWQRPKLTMLESGNEIIWLEGFGVSEQVKVEKTSTNIVGVFIKTIRD